MFLPTKPSGLRECYHSDLPAVPDPSLMVEPVEETRLPPSSQNLGLLSIHAPQIGTDMACAQITNNGFARHIFPPLLKICLGNSYLWFDAFEDDHHAILASVRGEARVGDSTKTFLAHVVCLCATYDSQVSGVHCGDLVDDKSFVGGRVRRIFSQVPGRRAKLAAQAPQLPPFAETYVSDEWAASEGEFYKFLEPGSAYAWIISGGNQGFM